MTNSVAKQNLTMISTADCLPQPDLIPGVYNYCDSWCERCPLTKRCRSYQLQRKSEPSVPVPAALLVEQLTEALNLSRHYIATSAAVPTGLSSERQVTLEEAALNRRHQTKDHPAATLATAYLKETGRWLLLEKELLERIGKQQLLKVKLGISTEAQAMVPLTALRDAHEQIRWYRTLIPVKTKAALRAIDEPADDEQLLSYYSGKAKLVLVSLDRSVQAWQTVMTCCPETIDDLLGVLGLLSQLTRQIETLFPSARAFKRPGLDERT